MATKFNLEGQTTVNQADLETLRAGVPTQEQTAPLVGIVIQDWLERADQAISALRHWKDALQCWRIHMQSHPGQRVHDDAFMFAVNKMAQAGLLEFIDSHELDELREMLTGVEA